VIRLEVPQVSSTETALELSLLTIRGRIRRGPRPIAYHRRQSMEEALPERETALVLRSSHPIVSVPFEEAVSSPRVLLEGLRQAGKGALESLLAGAELAGEAGKAISMVTSNRGVRLVFSKDTVEKLKAGEWTIPTDGATKLRRAEVRDRGGRIREGAKIQPASGRMEAVVRGVVAIAHVVSAVDTQVQLERISEKLDRLSGFLHAERLGELRGIYGSLQKALVDPDESRRARALEDCSRKLDELQGRFLESARAKLNAVRNPAQIGPLTAIFTSQSTAEQTLRREIGDALADLRLCEVSNHLNTMVHLELAQEAALPVHQRALVAGLMGIRDLLVQKAAFLDGDLADALATSVEKSALALSETQLDLDRGELTLISGR
jgi:hypothetical protein